ncbi:MAG: amino acid--tRNA ligase-related protein, partial [Planctomycetota bacterium]
MSEPRLPYGRTHTCGELREADTGKKTVLRGFVGRKLDASTFTIDDGSGRTLVVVSPDATEAARVAARDLAEGMFLTVSGDVQKRLRASAVIPTGAVYVRPSGIEVLSYAEGAPEEGPPNEQSPWEDRLRFRSLELRTGKTRERLIQRSAFLAGVRDALAERDFTEVDTPHLGPWSTEATDSFACPVAPDTTYALPGSPQPYKQLLMVGGVDRYFQIARCFRNEETLSPAHQLEYSALDLEMAYADDQDLFPIVEATLSKAFAAVGIELATPFPRLKYHEAMLRYGTDAPDLRFELPITALNKQLGDKLGEGRHARGLCAKGGAKVSDAE